MSTEDDGFILDFYGCESITTEELLQDGWLVPGTKVKFTNNGGYEAERLYWQDKMEDATYNTYTIDHTIIHGWSSYYVFREMPNLQWNTVMFERVEDVQV